MEKDFLRYLRNSLDTMYDYFLSDAWLSYQTNTRILYSFVLSCAYSYPDVQGKMLFNDPSYENASPKLLWMNNSRRLVDIAEEISGRKRSGPNDPALCDRAKSKIRALRSTVPDKWVGRCPEIPEEVMSILDNGSRYYNAETKR